IRRAVVPVAEVAARRRAPDPGRGGPALLALPDPRLRRRRGAARRPAPDAGRAGGRRGQAGRAARSGGAARQAGRGGPRVARAYDIPVLWIVFNNRAWNAVKRAVISHAPDGWAKRTGMPLTELDPPPDYEMVCQASGGWAERVESPAALPDAFRRALKVVR